MRRARRDARAHACGLVGSGGADPSRAEREPRCPCSRSRSAGWSARAGRQLSQPWRPTPAWGTVDGRVQCVDECGVLTGYNPMVVGTSESPPEHGKADPSAVTPLLEWPIDDLEGVPSLLAEAADLHPNDGVLAARESATTADGFFHDAWAVVGYPPPNLAPQIAPLADIIRRLRIAGVAVKTGGGPHPSQQVIADLTAAARDLDIALANLLTRVRRVLQSNADPNMAGRGIALVDRYGELLESRRLAEQARNARDEVKAARDEVHEVLDETRRAAGATADAWPSHPLQGIRGRREQCGELVSPVDDRRSRPYYRYRGLPSLPRW